MGKQALPSLQVMRTLPGWWQLCLESLALFRFTLGPCLLGSRFLRALRPGTPVEPPFLLVLTPQETEPRTLSEAQAGTWPL